MSHLSFSFNMNYSYGAGMFGGGCRPMYYPMASPFMMGAMRGYNSSMFSFAMMQMFNPTFSQSLFSMPRQSYQSMPSYNNSNTYNDFTLPSYDTQPMVSYYSGSSLSSDYGWSNAYSKAMNKQQTMSFGGLTGNSNAASTTASSSSSVTATASSYNPVASYDPNKKLGKDVSPEFINRVKDIATKLNCDWQDLMGVMQAESGLNPQSWNGTSAVGLIQFTNIAIEELRQKCGITVTKQQIANMSAMEQLDLVEKFLTVAKSYCFSPNAKLSAGDLYAIVFQPTNAGNEVLTRSGSAAYGQNPLDLDGNGDISKSDLAKQVAKKRFEVFG